MSSIRARRVLALNVRSQSFAFAVFEGPELLLDFGTKSFRGGVNAVCVPAGKKLAALLADYRPDVILVKYSLRARAKKPVVRAVKNLLGRSHIAVRVVEPRSLRRFFAHSHAAHNKYAVAAVIASRFPEIAWKLPEIAGNLPPMRKPENEEDYRVLLFDAIAIALAYFEMRQPRSQSEPANPA